MAALKRGRAAFEADLKAKESPFVFYGTALPPLDSDARDDGSYVPVWQQEVRDERGRKRFHGAFTGGFSSGYFNTVGSKEGFTPASFVSSRQNRAKDQKAATAEDFMDAEDLADAEESQKLETANSFAALGSTADDPKRRGLILDLMKSGGETMGVKLLQKMGWRQGQGVGPKVQRQARPYGEEMDIDEETETHLFAPGNSPMITFKKKNDQQGLGYDHEESLGVSTLMIKGKEDASDEEDDSSFFSLGRPKSNAVKKPTKRGGIGMGILNDTGSEDEDPFSIGPKISYKKSIGKEKKSKKAAATPPKVFANPSVLKPSLFKKSDSGFRKTHDGRLPLSGFVLAIDGEDVTKTKSYPPPKIPSDWKSSKISAADTQTSSSAQYKSTADIAKASTHDPSSRAALLGEECLPAKSIFSFMSAASRAKLAAATGKTDLPPAGNEGAPPGFSKPLSAEDKEKSLRDLIPHVDKDVAIATLQRGNMPYAEDSNKRERYRAFLNLKAGKSDELPQKTEKMSTQDFITEMREFAQVAVVFRPQTGLMASRFTSSSMPAVPDSGSEQKKDGGDSDGEPNLVNVPSKLRKSDEAMEAAAMDMFGPMTRLELPFAPTRLLCKRFGVKVPVVKMQRQEEEGEGM
ncbi:DUF1604-domain-containing protein [Aulographum hederae CBS 113979]|uniref:DUF1604-domain-containing protein n=1 Tax=Aulographum hederae CBS 113979 TaxID=1176131 RepID=A0A6G1GUZ6_9PEZI|nr:DUF1604-domain-containing protein [Aulographum hederae CBS 113979]